MKELNNFNFKNSNFYQKAAWKILGARSQSSFFPLLWSQQERILTVGERTKNCAEAAAGSVRQSPSSLELISKIDSKFSLPEHRTHCLKSKAC